MIHQVVFDTAELFYKKGVRHVVLSPGSRNAPLTISFARHPHLKVYSIIDERSAGFIALGIAQRTRQPVVICCTSGSALLNYLPAMAEAYYQQIPLLVLSADRPPEWIGQRDGQTIKQSGVTGNFTKDFFQMPVNPEHPDEQWEFNRMLNEAVNLSARVPAGPVHINVPFREPFYPENSEKLEYSQEIRIIENNDPDIAKFKIPDQFLEIWKRSEKKLIIIGQQNPVEGLGKKLIKFSEAFQVPILTELISNQNNERFVRHHDHYLGKLATKENEALKPDLVISFGKSVISKSLKQFLRKNKSQHHWHFEHSGQVADTFQSLTWKSDISIENFIGSIQETKDSPPASGKDYYDLWNTLEERATRTIYKLNDQPFSEYTASFMVGRSVPKNYVLHLANSMPVRYANLLRNIDPNTEVYCNRGTSGIDGSNGTAVGDALISGKDTLLWTGDLAFFYDRNAFFHHHDISNLRAVVMNNQGGGIFRLIDGPRTLPELEQFFETRHSHTAEGIAKEFDFEYLVANDRDSLEVSLGKMFDPTGGKKILEIFTEPSVNEEVYNLIKNISYE